VRITELETWMANAGLRNYLFVRLRTDTGLTGVGEASLEWQEKTVQTLIHEWVEDRVLGRDPFDIEAVVGAIVRDQYQGGSTVMTAISGVEIALWDLLGKARGLPLYELLGGLTRPRLTGYASLLRYASPADVAAACEQRAAQGFRAIKLHQIDVASVQAAREAVGPSVDIMLDTNCPWTPADALKMARAFEPYTLAWLEEPIWPPEEYDALAGLRRVAPMPIALGENESTAFGFREIIAKGAADILQPSVIKVGGIGEVRKIAVLAAAASLTVVPHSFYFGPGLAATLHLAATFTGTAPVELPSFSHEVSLLEQPIVAQDGTVAPPSGPGLGVAINAEAIRRYNYAS
jgi:L-alanine-DL-glutamate epimerase-like enolase superfamily enzyme